MDQLRQAKSGRQDGEWTKDQITAGLLRFYEEFGRFPKVTEVDAYPHLPTARSIQRSFGGLVNLKKDLGIKDSYHEGAYRSEICRRVNRRGTETEDVLYRQLVTLFGEPFVHQEKPISGTKERLDFLIYHQEGKVGVDVFYPDNLKNLQSNLNHKEGKYQGFVEKLYFVCANSNITEETVTEMIKNKRQALSKNRELLTMKSFLAEIGKLKPVR